MRKKILTGFFILLITSQIYGLALSHKTALEEKRNFARMPKYRAGRLLKSTYYKKLSRFLDDRYPYRSPLIIAKNWIDYYIFSTSPSQKVHIGKDGWFYLTSGMSDYLKDDCKKRKRARDLAKKLSSIEKTFESAGKRFFFIVAPDKATIYPEYVGLERPGNSCGKSFYDLFIDALGDYPIRGFIRLDNLLLEAKKDHLLYYKKGTHWNYRGAALAAETILHRLSTPAAIYDMPEIKYREVERSRDLAAMFALDLSEKSDYIFKIKTKSLVKTKRLKPLPNGRPRLKITAVAKPGYPLLPRAIIYRDSFMSTPLNLIKGSFEEMDVIWTNRVPVNPKIDFYSLRASKIVIIEVSERELQNFMIK